MAQASRRIQGITGDGSDGWDLYRRAQQMKADGVAIIDLTLGEHDIRTDPAILDAMDRAARGGHTGYAAIPGIAALRAAVAARASRTTGVPTSPEEVIITPGCQAALFAAFQFACDPGEGVVYIDPYYATYPGTIRAAGAVDLPVVVRAADGFLPQEEALAAAAEGAPGTTARAILVNSPNNPTGVVYPRATLEAIARVARARDLWLVSDEVYDSQVWEGGHLSPRALPGLAARTLVAGSLSKSHAMTGSRLGWVIAPAAAIELLSDLSTCTNYGIPGFIQDAGVFALAQGPEFEARIAEPFRRRREIALRLLAEQALVGAARPQGAMYVMLDLGGSGLDGEAFAWSLLEAERVAVMPGSSFGRAAAGHVRVALTVADDAFAEAFGRLLRHAARLGRAGARAAS
jgi:arginine:pyruvate transaminase